MAERDFHRRLGLTGIIHVVTMAVVSTVTVILVWKANSPDTDTAMVERLSMLLAVSTLIALAAGYFLAQLATLAMQRVLGSLVGRDQRGDKWLFDADGRKYGPDVLGDLYLRWDNAAQMLQDIIESFPLGLVVTDLDGFIVRVNRVFAELFGMDRAAILGQNLAAVFTGTLPDYRPVILEALASGKTVSGERDFVRRDGSPIHVSVTAWPLVDREGVMIGAYSLVRDLTKEQRLHSEWLAGEQALKLLRDQMYLVDARGRIIWTNQGDGLAGVDFLQRFCGGRRFAADGSYTSRIIEVLETGRDYVDRVVTSGDRSKIYRLNVRRLHSDCGDVVGCVSLCIDVTEEFKLKEQVMRSDRLGVIGELASTTAHELRNPLTAMRATAQLGLLSGDLPETREYFELIMNEVDRLNDFISELVMLSKPDKEPLVAMDVNDLCHQVLTLVHGKVLIGGVKVCSEFASGLPVARASRRLMKQALLNLITNAIQAMPSGGELTVRTRLVDPKHAIEITISDSGAGMPSEVLEHLFQPFFTTKEGGTGLGLAVTHQIVVDVHGGEINFTSLPGAGTSVSVLLPALD